MSLALTWQTLSDPTRVRLLALLRGEELSVAELQQILRLGQSRISTHLSVLRTADLVQSRREGKHTYYSFGAHLAPKQLSLIEAAFLLLAEWPEAKTDAANLKLALQKRRADAQNYFNRLAGKLGKAYCPGRTWNAVGPLLAQLVPRLVIADLGAGEGWLSQLLSQQAEKVIAIDNSPKMVAFGRAEAKKKKITNLEYRLGDIANPPIPAQTIDIAILSQALHHAVNPAHVIMEAAHLLKPQGRLIILDLDQHQFDKARQLYGDYWLGFNEADLRQWMREAGLIHLNVQHLTPDENPPHLRPCLAIGTKPASR
jgi:ubiquinone/menaquinone biosynthesis C-methylase UbiE